MTKIPGMFPWREPHLALLLRLQFQPNLDGDVEFPEINPKRPFGNGDIRADIETITGVSDLKSQNEYMGELLRILNQLHCEEPLRHVFGDPHPSERTAARKKAEEVLTPQERRLLGLDF